MAGSFLKILKTIFGEIFSWIIGKGKILSLYLRKKLRTDLWKNYERDNDGLSISNTFSSSYYTPSNDSMKNPDG